MVANYVTGRRVKVRTKELISACGTTEGQHLHESSRTLATCPLSCSRVERAKGGGIDLRVIGSIPKGVRAVREKDKVLRLNAKLQSVLHFGETYKG